MKPQAALPAGHVAVQRVEYDEAVLGSAGAVQDQLPPPAGAGSTGHAGGLGVGVMVMVAVTEGVPVMVTVTEGVWDGVTDGVEV